MNALFLHDTHALIFIKSGVEADPETLIFSAMPDAPASEAKSRVSQN